MALWQENTSLGYPKDRRKERSDWNYTTWWKKRMIPTQLNRWYPFTL